MSTALTTYQPGNNGALAERPAQQPAPTAGVVRLSEWAADARAANEVASSLVQTSFVPEAFRNKPYEATAAILAGMEVGLNPMASLRAFDVIQGTAAPRAITLRAIVQSRGHEVWVEENTESRAVVAGRRAGSQLVQRSTWTLDRARGLGLLGKHNWKAQPGAMLVARATAECCRLIASDAILGMPYSTEEISDGGGVDGEAPSASPAATEPAAAKEAPRTAKRRTPARTATQPSKAAAPTPTPVAESEGPPLPGEDGYDDDPKTGDKPATRAQLNKLHAQLNEFGVTERQDKLRRVSLLAKRELTSSSDLTAAEASGVIDLLERLSNDEEPQRAFDQVIGELIEAAVAAAEEEERADAEQGGQP